MTQYIHINKPEIGGVTLALYEDDGVVHVGASFCSPSENSFSRKRGREIASGRLEARRHGYVAHTIDDGSDVRDLHENHEQVHAILKRLEAAPYQRRMAGGPIWWKHFLEAHYIEDVIPAR